ncbi:actin cytoskeleton-regulatory complex protein pan1-like [Syzygium oleosum]|uniref:actin cytoskeleton-regulatory complex protein pan1-like n=1 Tax=Syzygium oleosum TaxID=219896 RepID=UPI0024BBBD50|nr:actin cytoskeleton-regulatory complex protein pan1-like [Syzygium oleosum]
METERSEAAPCYLDFTEDELRVADIILELRWLFADRFPRGWGAKRRRSALRGGGGSGSSSPPSPAAPSPAPPQQQPAKCPGRAAAIEERAAGPPKVHAASPDTPLSFSPSESDGNKAKQSHSKRKSAKRKREDWLKLVALLEEQGHALRKEVENVRRYRDQVKALNSELKSRKEELIVRAIPERSEQGPEPITRLALGGQPAEPTAAASLPPGSDRRLPPIPDQAASAPEKSETGDPAGPSPPPPPPPRQQHRGRDIPDLNIGLAPLDAAVVDEEWSNRARAAQARQRRKLIYRAKSTAAAVKPRVQLR